jgi:hypothetical protein
MLMLAAAPLPSCVEATEKGCEDDGGTRSIGESFTTPDGCRTCTCQADAIIRCTAGASDGGADAGPSATCCYGGKTYRLGERFPATDWCNTCTCLLEGTICTLAFCDK